MLDVLQNKNKDTKEAPLGKNVVDLEIINTRD